MASVTAFNDMMGQFLVELHKTFPEEKGLKKCLSAFDLMKASNPRLVVDGFMQGVTPYADKISAKDDSFFIKESKNLEFMKGVISKNIGVLLLKIQKMRFGNMFRPYTCLVRPLVLSQKTHFP